MSNADVVQVRLQTLKQSPDLPTLPAVYQALQEVLKNPAYGINQAAGLIEKDPALTVLLLKTVNSAAIATSSSVTKVARAINLLGVEKVAEVVLGVSLTKSFQKHQGDRALDLKKFWKHSIGVAAASQVLAKYSAKVGKDHQQSAFTAGMIHDVGKLVEEQFFHEEFTRALNLCKSENKVLYQAEKKIFGFTHQDCGAVLLESWNLPPALIKVVKHHNTPITLSLHDPDFALVSLIHIANVWSHVLELGAAGDPFVPILHPICEEFLEIPKSKYAEISNEIQIIYQDLCGVLLT